jgi:5-formyltetrahydrofolate cyclo-ligase
LTDQSKDEWRDWAKSVIADANTEDVSREMVRHLARWDRVVEASWILIYMPLAGEPDLTALMDGLVNASFATTRTPLKGPLTIHPVDGPMERHRFGYMQPAADATTLEPSMLDVVLVPGLAFDRRGNRLGWGAGYYDQLLVQLEPEVVTVGVVPQERIVLSLPSEAHDVAVTHLITENGLVSTNRK